MIEFVLTGDQTNAKNVVLGAVGSQGFAAAAKDDWNFDLTRGSNGLSIAFGALAGKKFFLRFSLGFSVDADKNLVARLSRDTASSAIRGGVLGATRASNSFQELADAIGTATTQAGVFASNRVLA